MAACGDDNDADAADGGSATRDAAHDQADAATTTTDVDGATEESVDAAMMTTVTDGGILIDGGGAATDGGGEATDGGGALADSSAPVDASTYPSLPLTLSLTGCADIELGPLCALEQVDGALALQCGPNAVTGTVTEDGAITLSADEFEGPNGTASLSCTGTYRVGQVTASCTLTSAGGMDAGAATMETCDLSTDRTILPAVECMELPSRIESVELCAESSMSAVDGGTCTVIQDGCVFQANCENDLIITGSVSSTGISFTQVLVALADAQSADGGIPAFTAGEEVEHSCTASVENGMLVGTCEAGRLGRSGMNTSICPVTGTITEQVPVCDSLAPSDEYLFVLNSCEQLRDGGEFPGIGVPVCAFRQTNCIWDVQCGNNPQLRFSGRVRPGATNFEWRLATGTPCEGAFDAEGNMTGMCTVPGQDACMLESIPAVPGNEYCPTLDADVRSRGCAGGDPLDCRASLQHQCNFMYVCQFSPRFPNLLIAGEASIENGRNHIEFNGAGDYQCYADEASEAQRMSGDRAENEWYGQCVNAAGGMCRDTYDPATGSGFRGLQLFFGAEEDGTN